MTQGNRAGFWLVSVPMRTFGTILVGLFLLAACSEDRNPSPVTSPGGFQQAGNSGVIAGQGGSAGTTNGAGNGGTAGTSAAGEAGTGGGGSGGSPGGEGGAGGGGAGSPGSAGGDAGAGGEPEGVCKKPVQQGEFYELSAQSLEQLDPIPMCTYQGQVVLIVNVASLCGYTPQYAPLQQLFDKYKAQGFTVLGFPSGQFNNQEFESDKEISEFCTKTYSITFPMFSKIDVNGPNEHPIYTWLKSQPGGAGAIPWNFTKFLLGRDGKLLRRISYQTPPDAPEVIQAIEDALKAP